MTTHRATWDTLKPQLDALRARIPRLQAEHPDEGDFFDAFAGEAEVIQAQADHDDDLCHHVSIELNHMLVDAGLLPEEHRQL
jgi:hypothetical protein